MPEATTLAPDRLNEAAARLLRRRATAAAAPPAPAGPAPLSCGQERLWFMSRLQDGDGSGGLATLFRLRGPLDRGLLDRALTELHARHDALRTTIGRKDGVSVQIVHPPAPVSPEFADVGGAGDPYSAARTAAKEFDARPYRLDTDPPIRWLLCRLGPDDHLLLLNVHHIAMDGWSENILREDLSTLLAAYAEGRAAPPRPAVQYADYARSQREWLASGSAEAERRYWRDALAGVPPVLGLPFDRQPEADTAFHGPSLRGAVPEDVVPAMARLAASVNATPFMGFLAAYALGLGRACRQTDLVIGVPAAGRTRPEFEGVLGFFINTVAIRVDLSGRPTFRDLLIQVRDRCLAAMAHQELPLEHVLADLRPRRVVGRQPVIQVLFQLYEMGMAPLRVPGVSTTEEQLFRGTSALDLSVSLIRTAEGLDGFWQYRSAVFDESTVDRLRSGFYAAARYGCAYPDMWLEI